MKVANCEVTYKFIEEDGRNELHILDQSSNKPIKSLTNGVEEVLEELSKTVGFDNNTKVYLYTTDSELVLFNQNATEEQDKFQILFDSKVTLEKYANYINRGEDV